MNIETSHPQAKVRGGQRATLSRKARSLSGLFASTCLIGIASAAMPSYAVAADAAPKVETTVEMVVVTARKRAENVQKVPIAITTFQKVQLEAGKLNEVQDILRLVPNVSFKNDQVTSSDIEIRGSARNRGSEEPGVGLNRDGVYVGGLLTNTSTLYDLDRVEVLRGPQAGLYGRNAVGGAVNFLTTRPTFDGVSGYLNVQDGTLDRSEVRGAVNLPIVADKLAVRLSGLVVDQDQGFIHVVNLGQYADAYRNDSVRARILFTPVEGFESLTTIEYFKTEGSPNGILLRNPFGPPFTVDGQTFPGASPENLKNFQLNTPTQANGEQTQFIEEANYKTAAGTITGTYGYRTTRFFSSLDGDSTNLNISYTNNYAHEDSNYSDLRFASRDFGGFHFIAGVTYMDEPLQLDEQYASGGLFNTNLAQWYTTGHVTANPFGIPVGAPITAFGLTPLGNSGGWSGAIGDSFPATVIDHQHLKSTAVYLEANYRLTDALELWGNVRYTHDDKLIDFAQLFGTQQDPCPIACSQVFKALVTHGTDPEVRLNTDVTFDNVSPGGGVNYTLSKDTLVYAKVVTGFKAGGFNSTVSSASLLPFNSETTISYELGAKSAWWDHRLVLNGDVFYQERKGALVAIPDPLFASLGVTYGVNAGLIENKGAELEARAVPIPGLDLSVTGGYLDSTFTKFVSSGINYDGNKVPGVFRYSFSGVASYTRPLTSNLDGFAYLSYSNAWDGYTNADNRHAATLPEDIDARLGVKRANWKVLAFVNNLTDHRYLTFESFVPGKSDTGLMSPGRTGGVELDYKF